MTVSLMESRCVRQAPQVVTVRVRGRCVVFDPSSRELFGLRPDAAAIWHLLDGAASVGSLAREMAEASGLTDAQALDLLRDLLQPLLDAGLVETVGMRLDSES